MSEWTLEGLVEGCVEDAHDRLKVRQQEVWSQFVGSLKKALMFYYVDKEMNVENTEYIVSFDPRSLTPGQIKHAEEYLCDHGFVIKRDHNIFVIRRKPIMVSQ